jgi:hypothetical protein
MPIRATEAGTEKIAYAIPSHGDTRRSAAQAKDIHVVVLHALASRKIVMTQGRSYSGHLIRRHRSADSAAAKQDTPFYLPARDRLCEGNGKIRIVVVRVVSFVPEIHDLMSFLFQPRGQVLLHVEATVICADTNLHLILAFNP